MAQAVYPPVVVVNILHGAFFRYRGLEPAPRGAGAGAAPVPTPDTIISDMEQFYYVRLDATRRAPRGSRDWVVVLVLAPGGKYAHHSPELRKLLEGVVLERAAKEGRLDELIVVAEEDFFRKKHLTEVLSDMRAAAPGPGGADPDGLQPRFSAHPYCNFCCVIPENESVPPHRILSPEEVAALLERERLSVRDLPTIYTSDPPAVWAGVREGQVVEIRRASQTALEPPYYRRAERPADRRESKAPAQ